MLFLFPNAKCVKLSCCDGQFTGAYVIWYIFSLVYEMGFAGQLLFPEIMVGIVSNWDCLTAPLPLFSFISLNGWIIVALIYFPITWASSTYLYTRLAVILWFNHLFLLTSCKTRKKRLILLPKTQIKQCILVQVYVDGVPSISSKEQKITIREFYGMFILPC